VSAAANGVTKTGSFTVTPNVPLSVIFSPTSVLGGGSSTGTVNFGRAVDSDTIVNLSIVNGSAAISSVRRTVTDLAGTSSATWQVTTATVSVSTPVQISATANNGSKTGTLTVTANVPTSVSFSPASVIGGNSSTGKVSFGRPVDSDTIVNLSIVNGSAA